PLDAYIDSQYSWARMLESLMLESLMLESPLRRSGDPHEAWRARARGYLPQYPCRIARPGDRRRWLRGQQSRHSPGARSQKRIVTQPAFRPRAPPPRHTPEVATTFPDKGRRLSTPSP